MGIDKETILARREILDKFLAELGNYITLEYDDPFYGVGRIRITNSEALTSWLETPECLVGMLYVITFVERSFRAGH